MVTKVKGVREAPTNRRRTRQGALSGHDPPPSLWRGEEGRCSPGGYRGGGAFSRATRGKENAGARTRVPPPQSGGSPRRRIQEQRDAGARIRAPPHLNRGAPPRRRIPTSGADAGARTRAHPNKGRGGAPRRRDQRLSLVGGGTRVRDPTPLPSGEAAALGLEHETCVCVCVCVCSRFCWTSCRVVNWMRGHPDGQLAWSP